MDANEIKLLRESITKLEGSNAVLLREKLRREAIVEGAQVLADVSLPASAKEYVIDTVLKEALPQTATGELDTAKLRESVSAEAKRFASAIGQGPRVTGMGAGATHQVTAEETARLTEAAKVEEAQLLESWSGIFGGGEEGKKIALVAMKGRAA